MATTQTVPIAQEAHPRRRLRNFMRRLAKGRRQSPGPSAEQNGSTEPSLSNAHQNGIGSSTRPSQSLTNLARTQSQQSLSNLTDENGLRTTGARSIAPTIATQPGTTHSDARSKSGTFTTGGGALSTHELGGEGSTFSSPAPSVRSLTTTLTTIQSTAPGALLNHGHSASQNTGPSHFFNNFPPPTPASAIPPHMSQSLNGLGHPHTYTTATANNVLTDDASILTLASSTKRRRRNSLDTNASVRALAPNSVFGGSRESLPLSVLSANITSQDSRDPQTPGGHSIRPNLAGTAAAERASIYSSGGAGAGASTEGREARSSYYASRANADGASVRSGFLGHGRNDSVTGSIGGQASPLASPALAEER